MSTGKSSSQILNLCLLPSRRVLKRRMLKLLIAVILLLLFVFACYFKSDEEEL